MQVLWLPLVYYFFSEPGRDDDCLHAGIGGTAELILDGAVIRLGAYGFDRIELRSVHYGGRTYAVELAPDSDLDLDSLRDGRCRLRDEDGNGPNLSLELLDLLLAAVTSPRPERRLQVPFVIGNVFGLPRPLRSATFLGRLDTGAYIHSPAVRLGLFAACIAGERIFGFDERSARLLCLDLDLTELWGFAPDYRVAANLVRGPELYGDGVILSFGPSRETKSPGPVRHGRQFADLGFYWDAVLACFAQSDGALRWQRRVAKSIDQLELRDDRLYVVCDNEILVLDPASGETLACVDTGLGAISDRFQVASSLRIEGQRLYFCHPGDGVLLVYRLADLALLRRVDIPAPYSIERFGAVHPATGRLYFHLRWREAPLEYFHMWPLLELDPEDLESELTLNAGPPARIELRPAPDEPGLEEVWIDLGEVGLDEALLYGEMHAEDQAYYHGQLPSQFVTARLTPSFNGRVHLRMRCTDASVERLHERLATLAQRFAVPGTVYLSLRRLQRTN